MYIKVVVSFSAFAAGILVACGSILVLWVFDWLCVLSLSGIVFVLVFALSLAIGDCCNG